MDQNTVEEGKQMGIIAYITLIGTLIAFFTNQDKRNAFTSFHIRQALNQYYEDIDTPPPLHSGSGYDGHDHDEVYIATDSEVSMMAGHICSLTLDTMLNMDPSEYDYPIYLVGFKREWIFESAFHVKPIEVNAPIRSRENAVIKDKHQDSFIEEIIKKKVDEITDRQ